MEDLWRLPAEKLAGLIKAKQVSAKEAAISALARLDAVNPAINAVVDHRPDDVLAQAAMVDAGIARGVVVDTSFFRGNYPEHCSLEAATLDGLPTEAELTDDSVTWVPLLPLMPLAGDSENPFPIEYNERVGTLPASRARNG